MYPDLSHVFDAEFDFIEIDFTKVGLHAMHLYRGFWPKQNGQDLLRELIIHGVDQCYESARIGGPVDLTRTEKFSRQMRSKSLITKSDNTHPLSWRIWIHPTDDALAARGAAANGRNDPRFI